MKIKDLRKLLKSLPANMEVVVDTGLLLDGDYLQGPNEGYGSIGLPVRKARTKLVKKIGGYTHVQSRPHKDNKAKLVLVIE